MGREEEERGKGDVLGRRLCKRQFKTSDDDESLRKCNKNISWCLDPHMYALLGRIIDVILQHARIHHAYANQHEPSENAADGVEVDLHFSEPGVHDEVEKGDEDDERDGVEVLQQVVGRAMECHFAGLRDQVVPDLDPADKVEGEEEEDLVTCVSEDELQRGRGYDVPCSS
jgi:hypothetical protein